MSDLLFEAITPIQLRVRVTSERWEVITTDKHPVMAGRESDVREVLENPDEVRASRIDPSVLLFYRLEVEQRWICAVVKRVDNENGFLITSYPTGAVKEGRRVWTK